jgi:hypothetical protein
MPPQLLRFPNARFDNNAPRRQPTRYIQTTERVYVEKASPLGIILLTLVRFYFQRES